MGEDGSSIRFRVAALINKSEVGEINFGYQLKRYYFQTYSGTWLYSEDLRKLADMLDELDSKVEATP